MCVRACVYMRAHVCVICMCGTCLGSATVHVCMCKGQRAMLGVSSMVLTSTLRFETGALSLERGVHYLAGLAGQQASGIHFVSAS